MFSLNAFRGELNTNGATDLDDLTQKPSDFGCSAGLDACSGDIDADGVTNLTDLPLLLANYGWTCPSIGGPLRGRRAARSGEHPGRSLDFE